MREIICNISKVLLPSIVENGRFLSIRGLLGKTYRQKRYQQDYALSQGFVTENDKSMCILKNILNQYKDRGIKNGHG